MNDTRYWLFEWLDTYDATTVRDAERLLADARAVDTLRSLAHHAKESLTAPSTKDTSILAGRGVDLSGHLDCLDPECRQRQVDDLLRHVWHYFDTVIAADAVAHEVSFHWDADPLLRNKWLLGHIRVLLHLRDIGAEDLIEFREKPPPCESHWQKHAQEAGLESVLEAGEHLTGPLAAASQIDVKPNTDGGVEYSFAHPQFEHTVWGELKPEEISRNNDVDIRKAVAASVLRRYMAHLTSDVTAARQLVAPLGSTIWLHRKLLHSPQSPLTTASVAFELELPVLKGVDLDTLIRIRHDDRPSFQRFQSRLRLAVKELSKLDRSATAAELSEQIRLDIIEPELRKIRDTLAAAQRVLARKASVGIILGAITTTCGLIAGMEPPTATAAGVGVAVASTVGATGKYSEQSSEVALSDMYFLWRAAEHHEHAL